MTEKSTPSLPCNIIILPPFLSLPPLMNNNYIVHYITTNNNYIPFTQVCYIIIVKIFQLV